MTEQTVTTNGAILTEIAQVMTDLSDLGSAKHGAANKYGVDTQTGALMAGQSHAYTNAAVMLQNLLDRHTN